MSTQRNSANTISNSLAAEAKEMSIVIHAMRRRIPLFLHGLVGDNFVVTNRIGPASCKQELKNLRHDELVDLAGI